MGPGLQWTRHQHRQPGSFVYINHYRCFFAAASLCNLPFFRLLIPALCTVLTPHLQKMFLIRNSITPNATGNAIDQK